MPFIGLNIGNRTAEALQQINILQQVNIMDEIDIGWTSALLTSPLHVESQRPVYPL